MTTCNIKYPSVDLIVKLLTKPESVSQYRSHLVPFCAAVANGTADGLMTIPPARLWVAV